MKEITLEKSSLIQDLKFVDYFILAKPGIVVLVLISTLVGVYFGAMGLPDVSILLSTITGIGLATAGSAVLNNYLDRDIDKLMDRTSGRAVAAGIIPPTNALILGLMLVCSSMLVFTFFVNLLAASLTLAAILGYVVLYGVILKRRSSFANQIGGLAGALPPVIGYAAVTGTVGSEALVLFLVMAIWQQPHALSLALKYRDDYAKASIPVVPVSKGVEATKMRILIYVLLLIPAATLPFYFGMAGHLYLYFSLFMGTAYLGLSLKFCRSTRKCDMFLFFFSIIYLTLLFAALVFDLT